MTAPSFDPSGTARMSIREIIRDYGASALDDGTRVATLLSDLLANSPREATLLRAASGAQVGAQLKDRVGQGVPARAAIEYISSHLAEASVLDVNACRWVVTEYAVALGYTTGVSEPAPPAPEPRPSPEPAPSPKPPAPSPGPRSDDPTRLDPHPQPRPYPTPAPEPRPTPAPTVPARQLNTLTVLPAALTVAALVIATLLPSGVIHTRLLPFVCWALYLGPLSLALLVAAVRRPAGENRGRASWYLLAPVFLTILLPLASVGDLLNGDLSLAGLLPRAGGRVFAAEPFYPGGFATLTNDEWAIALAVSLGIVAYGLLKLHGLAVRITPATLVLPAVLFVALAYLRPVASLIYVIEGGDGKYLLELVIAAAITPVVVTVTAVARARRGVPGA